MIKKKEIQEENGGGVVPVGKKFRSAGRPVKMVCYPYSR